MKRIFFLLFFIPLSLLATPSFSELNNISIDSLPWSVERHQKLILGAENFKETHLKNYPIYEAPFKSIDDLLRHYPKNKVLIFGYGSLLSKNSAREDLSENVIKTYLPAIAFGVKRVFDYNSTYYSVKWGKLKRPNDVAMLNIISTENFNDMVNGVVMMINQKELINLIKREEGYDLIPVVVTMWQDSLDTKINLPRYYVAYAFRAPEEPKQGKEIVTECINPVKNYAISAKEGAAEYGEAFLKFWRATTYLADKKTLFDEWEKSGAIDMWDSPACLDRER